MPARDTSKARAAAAEARARRARDREDRERVHRQVHRDGPLRADGQLTMAQQRRIAVAVVVGVGLVLAFVILLLTVDMPGGQETPKPQPLPIPAPPPVIKDPEPQPQPEPEPEPGPPDVPDVDIDVPAPPPPDEPEEAPPPPRYRPALVCEGNSTYDTTWFAAAGGDDVPASETGLFARIEAGDTLNSVLQAAYPGIQAVDLALLRALATQSHFNRTMTGITDADSNASATQRLLTLFDAKWGSWSDQWTLRAESAELGGNFGTLFIPHESNLCLLLGGEGGEGEGEGEGGGEGEGEGEAPGEECDPSLFIPQTQQESILGEVKGYIDAGANNPDDPTAGALPWMEGYLVGSPDGPTVLAAPGSWRSYYWTGAIRRAQMFTNPPRWVPGVSSPSGWPGSESADCAITEPSQAELRAMVTGYFDEVHPQEDA